jgi:serine/threonine protein kinase
MSPERIEGSVYGFKGDIWGIGLILYELATG